MLKVRKKAEKDDDKTNIMVADLKELPIYLVLKGTPIAAASAQAAPYDWQRSTNAIYLGWHEPSGDGLRATCGHFIESIKPTSKQVLYVCWWQRKISKV